MEAEQIKEFKEFLANTKQVNELTQYRYCTWIRDLDLNKLSQEYLNEFVQGKGNHSQIRGAVLNFLEMTGLNKTFDMPPKSSGRERKRIIRDISHEEICIVRDYLYSQSFKKGLIFDLTYQGALRRFEIPTIKMNSFKWLEWIENMDQPCHLTIQGKGNKQRTVLINPETAEKIFNHYNAKYTFKDMDEIRSFANSPSLLFGKLTVHSIWRIIHGGSLKAIGREIRPHELRHCRATELERMGVPIRDIKVYLGHSSIGVTEIYLHTSEKESIGNIQNILNKNQKG